VERHVIITTARVRGKSETAIRRTCAYTDRMMKRNMAGFVSAVVSRPRMDSFLNVAEIAELLKLNDQTA
jgi:hypothetical protein